MSQQDNPSQFNLLKSARFAPFFWTQFFGAFNDNVFKNALLILFTFSTAYHTGIDTNLLNNLAAALFILPFFLFSALAGEIADKYEKSMLIRRIKLFEIGVMTMAAIAFWFNSTYGLLFVLFLMGTQSTFFGPVKYSIIPQHLKSKELVGGNALVESGTFLAILLGTILGGVLSKLESGSSWVAGTVMFIAIIGWLVCRKIPDAPAANPSIKINFNPLKETFNTIQFARKDHAVFLSIMAISWFWFLGAAYLTQLPNFTPEVLSGDQTVVTTLLAFFSIGIALGSLLCEKLSGHKIELGLVPLGSIGLTIFGIDLFFSTPPERIETIGFIQFFSEASSYRVLLDFVAIGIFGGLYIVPLYAMIQERTTAAYRARTIAALNIMNALFMVVSAISGVLFLGIFKLSIPEFFLILAIMNGVVALYIYSTIPEFAMRFIIWIITHTMYRVKHKDLDKIPDAGAAVLVCNHVSYMDALIIAGACRRPVRFVMFKPIYDLPVLNFVFRTGKTIPIHSKNKDPETYHAAFESIAQELEDGEVVCIFPEGKLTTDGEIDEFKNGIEKIIARNPVPVIPMALKGLWGSFFSHKDGGALTTVPKRFWSRVELVASAPIPAADVTAKRLEEKVTQLRGDQK
ncbi:MAG: MFS transporter [Pseudomonadales bacterium]|nr:MFS transporter [Pseudomonadales bacterium]